MVNLRFCFSLSISVLIVVLFRTMYLLGYIPADSRLYLGDKELNVVSFQLLLSVLEYQTAVMRRDFETADKVMIRVAQDIRYTAGYPVSFAGYPARKTVLN